MFKIRRSKGPFQEIRQKISSQNAGFEIQQGIYQRFHADNLPVKVFI